MSVQRLLWQKIVAASLISISLNVFAANFGPMQVTSYLDQPLQANINVTDISQNTHISILKMQPVVPHLSLQLQRNATTNTAVVHITSSAPLSAPVFSLVLQLADSGESTIREYTVFLNPVAEGHSHFVALPHVPPTEIQTATQQSMVSALQKQLAMLQAQVTAKNHEIQLLSQVITEDAALRPANTISPLRMPQPRVVRPMIVSAPQPTAHKIYYKVLCLSLALCMGWLLYRYVPAVQVYVGTYYQQGRNKMSLLWRIGQTKWRTMHHHVADKVSINREIVEEIDTYLSYGQYETAHTRLQHYLAQQKAPAYLRIELMRVYLVKQDWLQFEEQLKALPPLPSLEVALQEKLSQLLACYEQRIL